MEAVTCSICSAKVRCAGVGLKSYLSSGKSSAMASSFRPISFHCDSTTCEGLGAGRGAPLAVRASKSEAPNDKAKASIAPSITFFIFLSLSFAACHGQHLPAKRKVAHPHTLAHSTHHLSRRLLLRNRFQIQWGPILPAKTSCGK